MCLAIPGKVIKILDNDNAQVDFDGMQRKVNVSLISSKVGDFVVVHAGFAIGIINEQEAKEILEYFDK